MTPELWRHATNGIIFLLCLDDLLIKYRCKKDAEHLLQALRTKYAISTDWNATAYCGVTLDWNYVTRPCDLLVSTYVQNTLKAFIHKYPSVSHILTIIRRFFNT